MVTTSRRAPAALITRLRDESGRFDFFQIVRLLERLARDEGRVPSRPVGSGALPAEESVRFRAAPTLCFPSAPVDDVRRDQPEAPAEVSVAFMGLTGAQGVLPLHDSALLIARLRRKDATLREFFDLFNHRAVSLFYRAWEKYRPAPGYERARLDGGTGGDPFTDCVRSLAGLGTDGMSGRQAFEDDVLTFFSGAFANTTRCLASLEAILEDVFEVPVHGEQFVGRWLEVPVSDRSAMPSAACPRGRNMQLGVTTVLGASVWDVQSTFRLRVGPLAYEAYCRLLPTGDLFEAFCQLVRHYVGPELDFEVQPVLAPNEIPPCRLGAPQPVPSRLGQNTWVRSADFGETFAGAVFLVADL